MCQILAKTRELYEQGKVEQLQQESDFDSFQAFDKVNESILKPLPKCTAQLGSSHYQPQYC